MMRGMKAIAFLCVHARARACVCVLGGRGLMLLLRGAGVVFTPEYVCARACEGARAHASTRTPTHTHSHLHPTTHPRGVVERGLWGFTATGFPRLFTLNLCGCVCVLWGGGGV